MTHALIKSFIAGYFVLIAAIVLNKTAAKLGISTWYDFIGNPSETSLFSYLWLFIIYPLFLGLPAYAVLNLMKKKPGA